MQEFLDGLSTLGTIDGVVAFLTLCVLEIVLGIDNLIFISLLVAKVPEDRQRMVRLTGLSLALIFRILLLLCITWIIKLTNPIITVSEIALSWRDIILLIGGLFLIGKSTMEIHHKISHRHDADEEKETKPTASQAGSMVSAIILQILAIDLIFSFDSILTAVGLTEDVPIMILAVMASIVFMMIFSRGVGRFINENPTIVILALAFLLMIGTLLVADALHFHVPRGYVYFALGFSLLVELLNLKLLKKIRRKKSL